MALKRRAEAPSKIVKVRVIGKKGHQSGEYLFPLGSELRVTETTLKNNPDRFELVYPKKDVKPIKIKKSIAPKKPEPKEDEAPKEPPPDDETAKIDEVLSEKVDTNNYPVKIGRSNWYRLSDGSKVQGRSKANKRQKALNG